MAVKALRTCALLVAVALAACSGSTDRELALARGEAERAKVVAAEAKAEAERAKAQLAWEQSRTGTQPAQPATMSSALDKLSDALYPSIMAKSQQQVDDVMACRRELEECTSKLTAVEASLTRIGMATEWQRIRQVGVYKDNESPVGKLINNALLCDQACRRAETKLAIAQARLAGTRQ